MTDERKQSTTAQLERVSYTMPKVFFCTRAFKRNLAILDVSETGGSDGIPATGSSFKHVVPCRYIPITCNHTPDNYHPIEIFSKLSKLMKSIVN